VAGDFTAKHIPWYKTNPIYTLKENYEACSKQTHVSTTSRLLLRYVDDTFLKIFRRSVTFFIETRDSDENLVFWKDKYLTWDPQVHDVMDRFLRTDKVFLDIGGWIGTTSLYGSALSRHVYVIEADPLSMKDLAYNCSLNARNVTLIERAITNVADSAVWFGKNSFCRGAALNDSTSQVYDEESDGCVRVQTITLAGVLDAYSIRPDEISLVKVDIEGGEECILEDLYRFHVEHNVPMLIAVHACWWKDANLDRFSFLTDDHKSHLASTPHGSILFE
jgi:FkbM family methyltransferase